MYVGTDSGLSIFNRDDSRFNNIVDHPLPQKVLQITSLAETDDGVIWIGTHRQGLLYYNRKTSMHVVSDVAPILETTIINDLMFDNDENELWLATTSGLWCAKRNGYGSLYGWHQPFSSVSASSIECIKKDAEGNIWVGTSNNGVFWYDLKGIEHHFVANNQQGYSLINNYIKDIFCNADGSIWLSTPKGLQVYYKNRQSFPVFKPEIRYNGKVVSANAAGLSLWKKYLVVATDKGVWVSDTNFSKSYNLAITPEKKQQLHFINPSIVDSSVLVTSSEGVYQLVFKDEKPRLARAARFKSFEKYTNKSCIEIIKATDSVYWMSTADNCYIMDLKSGITNTVFPDIDHLEKTGSSNIVTKIYKDRDERILVGIHDSIIVFTNTGNRLFSVKIKEKTPDILAINNVNDFYDDGKFIWLATNGKGLFRCNRKLAVLDEFTTDDDLCDNTIICIQPGENGSLWLTTSRGLAVYDTTLKRFSNYFQHHGLLSQEFNRFGKTSFRNQTLYFSSSEGIVQLRPYNWVVADSSSLHTNITRVMIGNEPLGRGELVLLSTTLALSANYGKNISLSFAAVSFLNSYYYSLQYKLSDMDQWIDIMPGSDIILNQLAPGTHKLHVRAVIKVENRTGKTFTLLLQINPAYYQQWWFITLLVALITGIIYSIYRYRIRQINKVLTIRTKISQDLHDNVGAALSSISIFSQAAIKKNENGYFADSRNILEKIGETSREVMGELNDTVWFINPGNDNLQKVVERITNYALPLCRSKDISFEMKESLQFENIDLKMNSRKAVYLVLKEAVNNSVKYASAKNLVIHFEENQKILNISIKDDGIGITTSNSSNGNGLRNMQQRVKDINGKIEIHSLPQQGTEIILRLHLTRIGDSKNR